METQSTLFATFKSESLSYAKQISGLPAPNQRPALPSHSFHASLLPSLPHRRRGAPAVPLLPRFPTARATPRHSAEKPGGRVAPPRQVIPTPPRLAEVTPSCGRSAEAARTAPPRRCPGPVLSPAGPRSRGGASPPGRRRPPAVKCAQPRGTSPLPSPRCAPGAASGHSERARPAAASPPRRPLRARAPINRRASRTIFPR